MYTSTLPSLEEDLHGYLKGPWDTSKSKMLTRWSSIIFPFGSQTVTDTLNGHTHGFILNQRMTDPVCWFTFGKWLDHLLSLPRSLIVTNCERDLERARSGNQKKSHRPFVAWRKENCLTAIATSKIMERGSLDNSYQKQSCACSHECLNLFEQAKHWTLRAVERTSTRMFLRTNQKSMPVFIGVWGESTESPSCLYYKCP